MTRGLVLLCGAWDEGPGYPRAAALRQGLLAQGMTVGECRAEAAGTKKQRLLAQPWRWPLWAAREWLRRRAFRQRLRRVLRQQQPIAVVVPYPGHLYVRDVAAAVKVPVVLDLLLSAYDTAVLDRRLFAPHSLPAWLLQRLDRKACAAADLVLLDTDEHAAHLAQLTGMPRRHFAELPVSDPDAPLQPAPYRRQPGRPLQLLFFGTGVPLHGLDVLLAAVARTTDVHLTLVGGTDADRDAARRLGDRVELLPSFVDRQRLQQLLDASELVAGVFAANAKTQRVVPFKLVHALAAGRPVITADTRPVRRLCGDDQAALLVPAGDAAALADKLQQLARDDAALQRAAAQARATYDRSFAVAATGKRLCDLLATQLEAR